ncbi:MAG: DUF5979 domain-containing protein [Buchananella hordeovulneris]|nr:DUF5979 domain-containing protein [Buchananella hordeovulneris]
MAQAVVESGAAALEVGEGAVGEDQAVPEEPADEVVEAAGEEALPEVPGAAAAGEEDTAIDAGDEGKAVVAEEPEAAPAAEGAEGNAGEVPGVVASAEGAEAPAPVEPVWKQSPVAGALAMPAGAVAQPQAEEKGSFKVKKIVVGGPASAAERAYGFYWNCGGSDGYFRAKGDGVPVAVGQDFPAGAECRVFEEPTFIDGYALAAPPAQKVTVVAGQSPTLEFTNTFTPGPGAFQVKKIVVGGPPEAAAKKYRINWKCGDENYAVWVKGDGVAVPVGRSFPAGTVCTVEENYNQAAINGYTVDLPAKQTITVVDGQSPVLEFTNTYTPGPGVFQVKKIVVGDPPGAAQKEYRFEWKCGGEYGSVFPKGDGVAVGIGRNFPAGTECTVKEDSTWADIEDYSVDLPADQTVTVVDGQSPTLEFTNTYTRTPGAFQVKKIVASGPPGAAGKDYMFDWKCGDKTGFFRVKGDGVAVPVGHNFPAGTECTVSENESWAQISGYALNLPPAKKITVAEGASPVLEFTNSYVQGPGAFQVKKIVVGGPPAAAEDHYWFKWTCGDEKGDLKVKGDGAAVVVGRVFPAGTECTVEEDTAGVEIPGYSVALPAAQKITVVDGQSPTLEFTNTYTKDTGSFQVKKIVVGDPPGAAGKDFKFNWQCGDEQGVITAKGDGTPVAVSGKFAVDTECTVSEDVASAAIDGYTVTTPGAQTVTIAKDESPVLEFTNTYVAKPSPAPSPSVKPSDSPSVKPSGPAKTPVVTPPATTTTPGGKLAKTGSDAIVVGSIAAALLIGGVLVLALRRRKE